MRCDRCGTRAGLISVSLAILNEAGQEAGWVKPAETADLCDGCVDLVAAEWNQLTQGTAASKEPTITLEQARELMARVFDEAREGGASSIIETLLAGLITAAPVEESPDAGAPEKH